MRVTVHQSLQRKQAIDSGIRNLSPNGSLRRGARYAALRTGLRHIPSGLRHVETEIGKWRAQTDARKPPARDQSLKIAGQRLGHTRFRSRIPVPVDTFHCSLFGRCSLFAPEFPPNGPTRTGEGLQRTRVKRRLCASPGPILLAPLGTLIPHHRSWAPAPPRVRRSDRNRRSVRGCRGSEHAWQHRASVA